MVAYVIQHKPAIGRSVDAQSRESMTLPSGSFLSLLAFLRACLDAHARQELSPDSLGQLLCECTSPNWQHAG